MQGINSIQKDNQQPNVVHVHFEGGLEGKLTFLDDNIFRYTIDPSGGFLAYATPTSKDHIAHIQLHPDEADIYTHPEANVKDANQTIQVSAGATTVTFSKADALMSVAVNGKTVVTEKAPLALNENSSTETIIKQANEQYFGGGTQNGRFIHTGKTIAIRNTNNWVDGGVASPNPFFWSTGGYGILRNTFKPGSYDFGAKDAATVRASHEDPKFDAYFFVTDKTNTAELAQALLKAYFKITGNPVLLPEYAFYLGHLNAYNRDSWADAPSQDAKAWTTKDGASASSAGNTRYESGRKTGYVLTPGMTSESLNGYGPSISGEKLQGVNYDKAYSAQAVIDHYARMDMPFGWMLPNDGYGAGYGQNGYYVTGGVQKEGSSSPERIAAVDANVANLKEFSAYANAHGVSTGLWTQSNLSPDADNNTPWHLLRDFRKEVLIGGISTLKTDVAWVGAGYSFGLNGIKSAYNIVTSEAQKRPNIITLDGWAGTQRYGAVWTGDQRGGQWEYIRFHIPTYIGQSLSGNPNIGSDMDGIFDGSAIIATRDYQWKTFTPLMLDMDGWGTYVKGPFTHGDPYTGISRMYLKLKSQLLPYIYTTAASAANIDTSNQDTGLPMIRALLLSDNSNFANSIASQYEYTFGNSFLVAPVYQNTQGNNNGDDIRNNIYLTGTQQDIWIDYLSGKQYHGAQVINNFDAPLWKLPVFVRANAIVPMYEANNNPLPVTDTNPQGLDKSKRIVEFFPTVGENSYSLYEDDGTSMSNTIREDENYGVLEHISYGEHVTTTFNSKASEDGTARFVANASTGSYSGYNPERQTTFVVNLTKEPSKTTAKNGEQTLTLDKVSSQADFDNTTPEAGHAVYFYDVKPNLNTTPTDENFSKTEIITTPKLKIKFARANVQSTTQTLELEGFENKGEFSADKLNPDLQVPVLTDNIQAKTSTANALTWEKVEGADSYELLVDGTLYNLADVSEWTHAGLEYHSTHIYKIRARNTKTGYSEWSDPLTLQTLEDPWKDVPTPRGTRWDGGYYNNQKEQIAFDHDTSADHFHSDGNALGKGLLIDYGQAYEFEKLEYYPRVDAGNGTVTRMEYEYSLDGIHWSPAKEVTWPRNAEVKTITFEQPMAARFVRLIPRESVGTFFAAREIALYKKAASSGFAVGSSLMKDAVSESDYSNMKNYLALEKREPDTATFSAQIEGHHADLNYNQIYDVEDYAPTMFQLDGGTRQRGALAGDLLVIPSKQQVKAGEEITVYLLADKVQNANALGALLHFDDAQWSYVDKSLWVSPLVAQMENLSKICTTFTENLSSHAKLQPEGVLQTANIALVNRGNKPLYSGSDTVASFKLRALKDTKVVLPHTIMMLSPAMETLERSSDGIAPQTPSAPEPKIEQLPQSAFSIIMTNDELTHDDGTNVIKMTQQQSYDNLFNNTTEYVENKVFEFKWNYQPNWVDGKLPSYIKLPTDITFTLNEPTTLQNVLVYNRNIKGEPGGNGTITKIKATVTFEDGTTQEFLDGEYDTTQTTYTFTIDEEHKNSKVSQVVITPLEALGSQMLTIAEIDFNHLSATPVTDELVLDANNATSLYVGDLSAIRASVQPRSSSQAIIVTSDKPDIASITSIQRGEELTYYVSANAPGNATITVGSVADPTKSKTYELTVKDGVDTSELESLLAEAHKKSESLYTKESFSVLKDAINQAHTCLEQGSYTKDEVINHVLALKDALQGLSFNPPDSKSLINTEEHKDSVRLLDYSSQITTQEGEDGSASNVLDYNNSSYWHTNWKKESDLKMPQWLAFDFGQDYYLSDVTILPRQNGSNGDILKAELLVAQSAEDATTGDVSKLTSLGTFEFGSAGSALPNRDKFQQMKVAPTQARYVVVRVLNTYGDKLDRYASAAEIRFYGTTENPEPTTAPDPVGPTEPVDPDLTDLEKPVSNSTNDTPDDNPDDHSEDQNLGDADATRKDTTRKDTARQDTTHKKPGATHDSTPWILIGGLAITALLALGIAFALKRMRDHEGQNEPSNHSRAC